MFLFRKKTPLHLQIEAYGKDQDTLLEFARTIRKSRIEEITHEDVQRYYKEIVELQASTYRREEMTKSMRKFFRYYRCEKILYKEPVSQSSLQSVDRIAMIEPMEKEKKKKPGQPKNQEGMKKVKVMYDDLGLTFREIATALKKDVRQIHVWYQYAHPEKYTKKKKGRVDSLSTV